MSWLEEINKALEGIEKSESVIDTVKKAVGKRFVSKTDYNSKLKVIKHIKEQLQVKGKQLEELQTKFSKQSFDYALEKILSQAGSKNSKAVKALLELDTIKVDGEELMGIKEQLRKLKETDPYLFYEK